MITLDEVISIGTLTRPHGKVGEVQCRTTNELWDDADATFLIIQIDGILVPFRVTDWRGKGADLIFALDGINTETAAQKLCGNSVFMLRRDVVTPADETHISWQDLIGWHLTNAPEVTISAVDDTTANVLAVLSDGRMVPLHEDLISNLDETTHTLTLTIPEGL